MIVKILVNGKEFGVNVYENNFDGEVQVNDTFHCEAKEDGFDTIFGTNDQMITVNISYNDIKEIKGDNTMYDPQCKHACTNCAGYETTSNCNHGCFDCIHFDGGNCVNCRSNYYNCEGNIPAADCHTWENAYITYHKDDGDAYTY